MWKNFITKTFFYSLLAVLSVGCLNCLVDPFDILGFLKIDGFNNRKTEKESHARLNIALKLRMERPEVIFFGTSRTEGGIDIANKNLVSADAMNCAFGGGIPVEYLEYFRIAAKNKVKHVLIGLDLFAFYNTNKIVDEKVKLYLSSFSLLEYIFSVDTLVSTVRTVAENIAPTTPLSGDNVHDRFFRTGQQYIKGQYGNKKFSKTEKAQWNAFKEILKIAQINNIKVTLFISPSHARLWESLDVAQGWGVFDEFRRKLVDTNEQVARNNSKKPFTFWDFSGYHAFTTEPVPPKGDTTTQMKWHLESSHYRKELGDIMLDRIFGTNYYGGQDYPDFGVLLTSENIEAHLQKLKEQRKLWQSQNQAAIELIKSIKK